ncbi:unnamed protein product [Clonostachys rosea]|uniref:Uncharacterized protein n=1 Tax=Bionectria ochroleuca TaxID=29856 RepID=A0ABY6U9C7_BIOOC|nr:unnamed protein product [Clonostachys rosea]
MSSRQTRTSVPDEKTICVKGAKLSPFELDEGKLIAAHGRGRDSGNIQDGVRIDPVVIQRSCIGAAGTVRQRLHELRGKG